MLKPSSNLIHCQLIPLQIVKIPINTTSIASTITITDKNPSINTNTNTNINININK